jgi:archaemetzincin
VRALVLFLLTLACLAPREARAAAPAAIYIQPLGEALPEEDVALVVQALRAFYGLDVRALPRRPLPEAAYYAPRKRYRADRLLDHLAPLLPADGVRILGLTAADISTTKGKVYDWGVLGLASLDGKAGVISAFRCHRKARDAAHARERLAKVAVHEIGHTQGLDHCPTRGCLMEDAGGQVVSTDREHDLCPRCRERLTALGRAAPPKPAIPWPAP